MAVLLALLSSLIWGTSDFLGGTASKRLAAFAVAGWSQAIGFVTALAFCLIAGSFAVDDLQGATPWAIAAGLCGFAALAGFYAALAEGTMGVVAPIAAMGVVVPVIAGVLDGERPTAVQVAGLLVAIIGVVLASGPELSGKAGARPLLLAAFAALGFGLALTFLAKGSESSVPLTLMVMRASSLVVVVVSALKLRSLGSVKPRDLPVLAGVGVGDVTANLFFALASTKGLLSLVAVAGSLYPVATIALARVVHHERLARIQYVGVAGALVGVVLISAG